VSVLIITLYSSENLSKKALLLLIRVVRGTSCCRCGTNCIIRRDGPLWLASHRDCYRGRWRRLGPQPEKLLEEVTLVRGDVVAGFPRLCANNKSRRITLRAGRCRDVVRDLVEVEVHDSRRRRKLFYIFEFRERDGVLHELSPDRKSGFRAFEF